jgi:hypothetical protein
MSSGIAVYTVDVPWLLFGIFDIYNPHCWSAVRNTKDVSSKILPFLDLFVN